MREGLRAEYPGLFVFARAHHPKLGAGPPAWAALAAIGAAFAVGSITTVVLGSLWQVPPQASLRPNDVGAMVGGVAGGMTASAIGGRTGFFAYAGYVAVMALLSLFRSAIIAALTPSDVATALSAAGAALGPLAVARHEWPTWLAVFAGAPLARAIQSRARGANPALEGAGAFAAATALVTIPLGMIGQAVQFSGGNAAPYVVGSVFVTALLQATVAAVVIARRAARPLRAAAIVAALALLQPLVAEVPQIALALRSGQAFWITSGFFAPIAGALLVPVLTAVFRRA